MSDKRNNNELKFVTLSGIHQLGVSNDSSIDYLSQVDKLFFQWYFLPKSDHIVIFALILYNELKFVTFSQIAYNAKGDVYSLLGKTFSLCLLPTDDIKTAFDFLSRKSNTNQTNDYFDYLKRTWIENSIWPINSWSVNERAIRTNNDCKGWHNKLNRRARKGNLPFYLLLTLLFEEARDLKLQSKLVKEKKTKSSQTKQTKECKGAFLNYGRSTGDGKWQQVNFWMLVSRFMVPTKEKISIWYRYMFTV